MDPIAQNAAATSNEASLLVLKKAQDAEQMQAEGLLAALPQSANMPNQGQNLDVTA